MTDQGGEVIHFFFPQMLFPRLLFFRSLPIQVLLWSFFVKDVAHDWVLLSAAPQYINLDRFRTDKNAKNSLISLYTEISGRFLTNGIWLVSIITVTLLWVLEPPTSLGLLGIKENLRSLNELPSCTDSFLFYRCWRELAIEKTHREQKGTLIPSWTLSLYETWRVLARMSCFKPVSFWVKSVLEVPLLTWLCLQVGQNWWRTWTNRPPSLGPSQQPWGLHGSVTPGLVEVRTAAVAPDSPHPAPRLFWGFCLGTPLTYLKGWLEVDSFRTFLYRTQSLCL